MRYGCLSASAGAGIISMPAGTTQQFVFPLAYEDASQGPFEAALTGADFFVGKKASTPEADAVIHRTLGGGIAEETVDGARYLVVSLTPADSDALAGGQYHYAAVIEWGASDRAVIGKDIFILESWPGHPPAA